MKRAIGGLMMLISICVTPVAFGDSHNVGNGGDVVFCDSGLPFQIDLLDFYEAKVLKPTFRVDLSGQTLAEKISYNLAKIARVSKVRAGYYQEQLDVFFDKVFWVRGTELIDIPDSNHLFIPNGCRIRQIAIQMADDQIPGKKYIINQDLWDLLTDEQKVGLVFHEVIYTEAIRNGYTDSVEVRKLNSWIADADFANVTVDTFSNRMTQINFPTYLGNPNFPSLLFSNIYKNAIGNVVYGEISHVSTLDYLGHHLTLRPPARVLFYPQDNTKIMSINFRPMFRDQKADDWYVQDGSTHSDLIEVNGENYTLGEICSGYLCSSGGKGNPEDIVSQTTLQLNFAIDGKIVPSFTTFAKRTSPLIVRGQAYEMEMSLDSTGYPNGFYTDEIPECNELKYAHFPIDNAFVDCALYSTIPQWPFLTKWPDQLNINKLPVLFSGPVNYKDVFYRNGIPMTFYARGGSQFVDNKGTVVKLSGSGCYSVSLREDGRLYQSNGVESAYCTNP